MIEIYVEREEIKRDIQANTFDVIGNAANHIFQAWQAQVFK
jgi:hypothetical protein